MADLRDLYNEDVSRRSFLRTTAVGVAAIGAAKAAEAADKALDDAKLNHHLVTFKSGTDIIDGFLVRPKAAGRYPAVLMIPGIFGVDDYMRETGANLAQDGFAVLVINMFARNPEIANVKDIAALRPVVNKMTDKQFVQDLLAGISYLKSQNFVKDNGVGVTGFCMGGRLTLLAAAHSKDVKAAVPYYGPVTQAEKTPERPAGPADLAKEIRCPVQGHYGTEDAGIPVEGVKAFEAALKAQGTPAEFHFYPAPHAFHDFSRAQVYREAAARQAWERTEAFFKQHLK